MKNLFDKNQNIEFDYYAETREDFYRKFSERSVLVQGQHWATPPMVSILLPTYKRPQLLKQALESALNQVHFEDYQIIVADNEGAPLEQETETSKLIAQYSDPKIVYYRHERTVEFTMDYVVKLARSPWICFLHDDDLLNENYLSVFTGIVKKNKNVKFLSCPVQNFVGELSEKQIAKMTKGHKEVYRFVKYQGYYACTGHHANWLGSFMNRQCYIDMGGMPSNKPGMGDYIMMGKFNYHYGVYQCISNNHLYYYRRWKGQQTAGGAELWTRLYVTEYKYHLYVNQKCHKFFLGFWNRISAYKSIELIEQYYNDKNGYFADTIDINRFIEQAGMPHDIWDKGIRYRWDMLCLGIYEYLVTRKTETVRQALLQIFT